MKLAAVAATVLVLAAVFPRPADSRPVIVEESTRITNPDPANYPQMGDLAIDGEFAVITAHRFNPPGPDEDPFHPSRNIGVFLYRLNDGAWTLVRRLTDIHNGAFNVFDIGIDMRDGVMALAAHPLRVFQRSGPGEWRQREVEQVSNGPGRYLVIDNQRIFHGGSYGTWAGTLYEPQPVDDVWRPVTTLRGEFRAGDDQREGGPVDLSGGLAVVSSPFTEDGDLTKTPNLGLFQEHPGGWSPVATILPTLDDSPYPPEHFGSEVVLRDNGNDLIVAGSVRTGSHVLRRQPGTTRWVSSGRLQPLNSLMGGGPAMRMKKSENFVMQLSMDPDRDVSVINVFSPHPAGDYRHVATLRAGQGDSLGDFNIDGRRVLARCGDDACYFQLPAQLEPPSVLQDTFAGNASRWTTSGGRFAIVQSGAGRVFRQSDPGPPGAAAAPVATAELASAHWTHQSVQAEIRPRVFNGRDRWFGLATRYRDPANYHYVTLRSSGSVQLRRMRNGSFVTLASAPLAVAANRDYRVRLESTGSNHRVYVDGEMLLDVDDAVIGSGRVALLTYRTAADFDNVIATPSPLTTIYSESFESCCREFPLIENGTGLWSNALRGANGVLAQSSVQGVARAVIGVSATDQVVEIRARPTTFEASGSAQDRWVGVMARHVDDANYYYLVLRSSNSVSLRKLHNGQISVLGTASLPVTPGNWYGLRLEAVGDRLRAYVNGRLLLEAVDRTHPSGAAGLVTWRAAADFDDFKVYQP